MATFTKFNCFALDLSKGVHNLTNNTTGNLKIALTNTAPSATYTTLSQITQISYTNISSPTMPADTAMTATESPTATWQVSGTDITITASGTVATFRYVVLYNDTPTSPADPLIGYWDYSSGVSLTSGESFTVDFQPIMFTVA
jgi:hypothetical protein